MVELFLGDAVAEKGGEQFFMRARDDVRADEFADFGGGFGASVHSGLDAADVALGDDGDESAADGDGFDQRDVGFGSELCTDS